MKFLDVDLKRLDEFMPKQPYSKGLPAQKLLGLAKDGDIEAVRSIIEEDRYVVYCFNNSQQTALHVAAANGHAEMIELLL